MASSTATAALPGPSAEKFVNVSGHSTTDGFSADDAARPSDHGAGSADDTPVPPADAAARRDRGYRKGVPIELVIITVQDPAGQGQIVAEAVLNAAI